MSGGGTTIKLTIGTFEVMYVAKRTTAPRNYDGFGTLEIYSSLGFNHGSAVEDKELTRLVLVDTEHEKWQTGRYFSGLYSCEDAEGLEDYVQRNLLARVRKNDDD